MKIIFWSDSKSLVWLKIFEPAQKNLGPVEGRAEGQGISKTWLVAIV